MEDIFKNVYCRINFKIKERKILMLMSNRTYKLKFSLTVDTGV